MTSEAPATDAAAVAFLLTPEAVRARAHAILALGKDGKLPHFRLRAERLPLVADYVADEMRANYPDLDIPLHSRWRHFAAGGIDRWHRLNSHLTGRVDERELARIGFDLVIPSVLLDAGAGPDWRYVEGKESFARSEGLAVASFYLFTSGALSSADDAPFRTDARALSALTPDALGKAFQVTPKNPLLGLEGRAMLMRRLGNAMRGKPALFGPAGRPGSLVDYIFAKSNGGKIPAREVLRAVLEGLGEIWPGRTSLGGVNLGDAGRHGALAGDAPGADIVPFHKLSQWLTYSLIEPLAWADIKVTQLDGLTGLPEYRNGGLLLDLGLLEPRDPTLASQKLKVESEPVVEWRALTVALLDELAPLVREKLGKSDHDLPLGRILQGGSWSAGRKIAAERRPGGPPPLTLDLDGTVF